jgi:glucosamine-6-phosphate deaminase
MKINIANNKVQLGEAAGRAAGTLIVEAIERHGQANVILATGTSQFETLNQLINEKEIDWSKVVMFHLDEYIGLTLTHPASFRKYLTDRFLSKVPA